MLPKIKQYTHGLVIHPKYLAKFIMLIRTCTVETINAYLDEHPAPDGHKLDFGEDTIVFFENKALTPDFIAEVDSAAQEEYAEEAISLEKAMNLPDLVIEFDFSAKPVYIPADPELYGNLATNIAKLLKKHQYVFVKGKKIRGWIRPFDNGKWFTIIN